jgi:hypothetical protein
VVLKVKYLAAICIVIGACALLVWFWSLMVRLGVSLDSKYEVFDEATLQAKDNRWSRIQVISGSIGGISILITSVLVLYRWFINPSKG